ncbi:hypothetical protein ACVI1J_007078 [Bradyrhizobium diazoefficiens]
MAHSDHGIVRDQRAEDQPRDKQRAQINRLVETIRAEAHSHREREMRHDGRGQVTPQAF